MKYFGHTTGEASDLSRAGDDPMNVFRTAGASLEFQLERDKAHFTDGFENLQFRQYARWSPFFRDLCDLFAVYNEKRLRDAMPAFPLEQVARGRLAP